MVTLIFWGNTLMNMCEHPSQTGFAERTETCLMPVKVAMQVSNIECFWQIALNALINWNVYE